MSEGLARVLQAIKQKKREGLFLCCAAPVLGQQLWVKTWVTRRMQAKDPISFPRPAVRVRQALDAFLAQLMPTVLALAIAQHNALKVFVMDKPAPGKHLL
jgi:hypothetical protein